MTVGAGSNSGGSGGSGGGGGSSSGFSYYAIGAPQYELSGTEVGAVYLYDYANISNTPTVLTDPVNTGRKFGSSIVSTSNKLIVGSPGNNSTKGSVYVYDRSNLSSTPTALQASGLSNGSFFGKTLAVSDSYLVVGAEKQNSSDGAVYVYDLSNLSASPTELTGYNSRTGQGDEFGSSLAIAGDYLFVGAPKTDNGGTWRGSVNVYDLTTNSLDYELFINVGNYNRFGMSLATAGNSLYVGNRSGTTYLYEDIVSDLSSTPTSISGTTSQFGMGIALSDDYAVIGYSNTESAFVYNRSSANVTSLTPPDSDSGDRFGEGPHNIAIAGDNIAIGADGHDGTGNTGDNDGIVYIYDGTNLSASPTTLNPSALRSRFGTAVHIM